MMLDSLSFGLIMPVMPDLLVDLGCGSISDAAFYGGLLSAAFSLMQLAFGPLMGNLSDRFGRWPLMLVSLVVLFVDYVIKGFAHSMWLLFFGRIICGIGLANYSNASAIIADTSAMKDRAKNFGMLGTAIGFGFILGALLGGPLSAFGLRAPFYAAAVLSTANLIFCIFFLKESLSLTSRRPFSWARSHPLGALKSVGAIPGLSRMLLVLCFYESFFFRA
jgi:DHA1 family tetracycline resistance protein-like MFS transporter